MGRPVQWICVHKTGGQWDPDAPLTNIYYLCTLLWFCASKFFFVNSVTLYGPNQNVRCSLLWKVFTTPHPLTQYLVVLHNHPPRDPLLRQALTSGKEEDISDEDGGGDEEHCLQNQKIRYRVTMVVRD